MHLWDRKLTIIVAEPWDFTSLDGDNKLCGKIIKKIVVLGHESYIVKLQHPLPSLDGIITHVLVYPRNNGDFRIVNVYSIPEGEHVSEQNEEILLQK